MNKFLETFLNASTKFLDLANQTNQTIMTANLHNNNIQENNNDSVWSSTAFRMPYPRHADRRINRRILKCRR